MKHDNFTMLINGLSVEGKEKFGVVNPATSRVFAHAPNCTSAELDIAVQGGKQAFKDWSCLSYEERGKYLVQFAETLQAHSEDLARLLIAEQGKPFEDAMLDIMFGLHWLVEFSQMRLESYVSEDTDERKAITSYEPLGVVAGIVPWNFPVFLAMTKIAPALQTGNTIVLKPAPTTPLTTLRIGELAKDIFPKGVLNIISGDDRLGPWLTSHSDIDKITFTGSTVVGQSIMREAASDLKRVTLELGGNDAAIVLPDVDLEKAIPNLFWAAFKNAGQVCIAAKRLYIHADIYDQVKEGLVKYAGTVKIGDGAEPDTAIGPVQNERQYHRLLDLLKDAKNQGLEFVTGGDVNKNQEGYFIPVTILDNPPENARIVTEEQFGPIAPLIKFDDMSDVIDRANASEYGLGASIWTQNMDVAQELASKLEAGTIWVNETQYASPYAAFGGYKKSGIGVENGSDGLKEFTHTKTVFLRYEPAA